MSIYLDMYTQPSHAIFGNNNNNNNNTTTTTIGFAAVQNSVHWQSATEHKSFCTVGLPVAG